MSNFLEKTPNLKKRGFLIAAVMLVVTIALILIIVPGFRSGARSTLRASMDIIQATLGRHRVMEYNHGQFTDIIFLHHSTGKNLIDEGLLREQFSTLGYSFWDHGYNHEGLRDPNGIPTGYSYRVPGDNTNPDGMARIFGQRTFVLPLNTFSALMQHEVILFKSCFVPTSKINSGEQLTEYKAYYLEVRNIIDQHPEKAFILITQPPLNPAETNPEEAARARALVDWLASDIFIGERQNLFVFNLFDHLAEDDPNASGLNMLRAEYRYGDDSHPNQLANQEIGPDLVEFVVDAIDAYRVTYRD